MASDAQSQQKGKKKGLKFPPLPSVKAAEDAMPWHVEVSGKLGRHAVADSDIPAGTLVLVERPFIALPLNKYAGMVCHRCLRPLEKQPGADTPQGGNPCLPRHCTRCKQAAPTDLDTKLAGIRIKLKEISETHQIDPIMLHLPMLLDLQRAGVEGAGAYPPDGALAPSAGISELRCSVADFDALSSYWDRKPEAWRKNVGPALRALHKELTALAASGSIPGYTQPGPITRLQADDAMLTAHIHSIGPVSTNTDTGVGLFPALSVFHHSCAPNCWFTTDGPFVIVRTLMEVPAGTPLTVSYVPLTEPRGYRQEALKAERNIACSCERCVEPLQTSPDRLLEGILCVSCAVDVMLPLEAGPANDEAAEEWKQRVIKELADEAARNARRRRKKGAKIGAAANGEDAADADASAPNPADIPEGVMFWRCCNADCRAVEPAHNVRHSGPGDVAAEANALFQKGMALVQLKHAEFAAQGEAHLETIITGLEGRLPVYHHRFMDALMPLINLNVRKGEPLKVINYSIQLWEADRNLLGRATLTQLRCLQSMVDAVEVKASAASSAVIKRQFARRLKLASNELHVVRHQLLGAPLPPALALLYQQNVEREKKMIKENKEKGAVLALVPAELDDGDDL